MYRIKANTAVDLVKPANRSDRLERAIRVFDRATTRRERSEALVWLGEALESEPGIVRAAAKAIVSQLQESV